MSTKYGWGKGQIWMDGVKCSGTELSLDDCKFENWENKGCDHTRDVSIDCEQTYEQGVILLYPDPKKKRNIIKLQRKVRFIHYNVFSGSLAEPLKPLRKPLICFKS